MPSPANPPDPAADGAPIVPSPDNYWISVQIAPPFAALLDADHLHALATFTLKTERHLEALEVGITVADDTEIHRLNKEYLAHDYPTDVLSFGGGTPGGARDRTAPAADADAAADADEAGEGVEQDTISFVTPPGWPAYLGDVVISYETAAAQAADYGHPPAAEVDVLLVHGLLHLLGYDDQAPADRENMHRRQDELLAAFARAQ